MPHAPTIEQQQAIELALQGQSFKVVAYAGTGKTTTLQMLSDVMPQRRGMYLAFNKGIADEAARKFHHNVSCRTFHSLAYRQTPREITDKLRLPRLSPAFLAHDYALQPMPVRRLKDGRYEKYTLMPNRLAGLIVNAIGYFCATSSQYPAARHIQAPTWLHPDDVTVLQNYLYPFLQRRWLESIDPQHQAGIGHDIYLKLWALSEPQIHADYVLFDEAQDADPIMLGILLKQKNTQVIYVGDPHQQIYEWRGAVNAMQRLPLPQSLLTTSFRFGAAIAESANILLSALGETTPLQGTAQKQSQLLRHKNPATDVVLCRTNARAMQLLIDGLAKGERVALQADYAKLNRFVQAAELLKQGKASTDVAELAWFGSWNDVQEYCETHEGNDIKPLVKLVDDHGTQALQKALKQAVNADQAKYMISTAHKAKGLQWQHVHIEDDYLFKCTSHSHSIEPEELRLLYVACTRAQVSLNIQHIDLLLQQLKLKMPASMRQTSS